MDAKESFFKIKEVQSLCLSTEKSKFNIVEQQNRVLKVRDLAILRAGKQQIDTEKIKERKIELLKLEAQIDSNVKKIDSNKTNLGIASTVQQVESIETNIKNLTTENSEIEDQAFTLMERIEKHATDISEYSDFKISIEYSIDEITKEANELIESFEKIIINNKERVKLLAESLDVTFQNKLSIAIKKHPKPPLFTTRNKNGACQSCGMGINKSDEDTIEVRHQIHLCGTCSRIFIPISF